MFYFLKYFWWINIFHQNKTKFERLKFFWPLFIDNCVRGDNSETAHFWMREFWALTFKVILRKKEQWTVPWNLPYWKISDIIFEMHTNIVLIFCPGCVWLLMEIFWFLHFFTENWQNSPILCVHTSCEWLNLKWIVICYVKLQNSSFILIYRSPHCMA